MQKIVKLNRALLYCCMVVLFCLHFTGYAAPRQGKPVSITIKNSSLAEVLRQVSKKSGLYIYFQDADLAAHKSVTIDVKNKPVENVLHELLDGRGFSWVEVSENTIAVKKKPEIEEKKVEMDTVATKTVRGRVTDENGDPLIGATVVVKNSLIGTTTNNGGEFILNGVRSNSLLVISNVSFLTQEVPIKGRNTIGSIQLRQYVKPLDEVQIQAYGTTNRRIGTGNISTVKAEDIAKAPVANPLLAIAGRVPGVFIQQATGVPGSGVKVIIQGQNSVNGNDPFYVIDGVPYTAQLLPGLTEELGSSGTGGITSVKPTNGNPLNFINPQDIESIDILKDADATSIYGSRAAGGAIIITTKKGKAGKIAININAQNGWGKVTKRVELLNTEQYLEMRREAYTNDNLTIPSTPTAGVYDLTYWDQGRYTDWQKELIGGTASYTNILGSLTGGNANTQFLFSGGYQRDGTVTPGDLRNQKATIHFNLNSTSDNKKFKFGFSANYMIDDNKLALVSQLSTTAFTLAPNAPRLYNADGTLNWEPLPSGRNSWINPLAYLEQGYINKTSNLVSNALLGYKVLPELELKGSFGYNKLESNEIFTFPLSFLPPSSRATGTRRASFNTATISTWIIEPQLSYIKQWNRSKIDALLGTTIQQEDRDRQRLNASGFSSDQAIYNIKSASSVVVDGAPDAVILSEYKYNALFGRLNYSYDDKYILTTSIRRDGSSRFGKENRFHNFASIAGAWVFSNEPFVSKRLNFLSFGKIRASYGTTGNDQIGDYSYLNLYGNTPNGGVPYQGIIALEPSEGFPNPYLQWEETKKFSTTLDLGFLNDRILINATYYKNSCSNQLINYGLITVTGGNAVYQNRPLTVQNTGIELGINTVNISSAYVSWSSSLNLTIPRNILKSYGDVDVDIKSDLIGKSLSVVKVYRFNGVDPTSGLYTVWDRDGKSTSTPDADLDKTVYINLDPKFYGGIQNSITYRNLSLDVLFQFVKQKAVSELFGNYPGFNMTNQLTSVLDRWRKAGDQAEIQKYNTNFSAYNQWYMATQSDKNYSDASYIRLKNLSLSYKVPQKWLAKANVQSARVYMQGQNLLTFTNYIGGDPENRTIRGLPPLKTLTLGIQVGF